MELVDILAVESVTIHTDPIAKDTLLRDLSARAAEATGVTVTTIHEAVASREQLGSTGLGNGIAIPHGKLVGLKGVTAVFARLDTPIEFGAVDDQPVDLVMLLLAPVGSGAEHLKALARVARVLRTDAVTAEIRAARDAAEIYDILTRNEATHQAA